MTAKVLIHFQESYQQELEDISLEEPQLPFIENPLLPTVLENTVTGPNTLNLPAPDQQLMTQAQAANQFSNLTMDENIRLLFPRG